ncbi:MAG: polysaccharide biosynthesis tyrosine autokinase [Marivita sp.]|uniref:polysaccharide biosynthesis tyrosine autokinase n=1 Tax=Marivita sp. TaxID=2003365 RepID=UPI003EF098FD
MQEVRRIDRAEPLAQIDNDEIDLLELFATLWRGKLIILAFALAALLLGATYAFVLAVPKYTASTTLAVQPSSSNIVDIESVVSGVSSDISSLNTELEVIKSRKLIEQLVQRLSLVNDPEFNLALVEVEENADPGAVLPTLSIAERALGLIGLELPPRVALTEQAQFNETVDRVSDVISASLQRNTFVFSISVKTTDPQKSVEIVNALAELYISDQIAVKFEATENAVTWLSERVTDLEVELTTREDEIKELRAGSTLITPEALAALNQQASDMRERLADLRSAAVGAEERLLDLRKIREAGDINAMQAAFSDPVLRRLFNDVAGGNTQSRGLFEDRYDLLVTRDTNDVQRAISQVSSLELSYDALQTQIAEKTQDLVELQQAEREVDATGVLYETFLARLKETTVQRGLQEADARILSPAVNGLYVEPRRSLVLALSLVLGSLLGAGLVLINQLRHSGVRTADDLEKMTGLNVLGQVPKMPIKRRDQLVKYLNDKPTSAASEAIRNLRTSILLSNIDNPPKVIMSTSSVPGEGKTTLAIALAHNFVGLGKSVLLIEGDIRRRTLSEYFENTPDGGLIAALSGDRPINEVVFHDKSLGADVLMGEKSNVNAADLFSSDRFQTFLHHAREAYDIIIIDTPPVLVVPDARVLGQAVDALVYAVKWDKTAKRQIEEGVRQFATANLKITGFVLSQIDPKGMQRYGYGGKYGSYGAYGSYGKGYYDT